MMMTQVGENVKTLIGHVNIVKDRVCEYKHINDKFIVYRMTEAIYSKEVNVIEGISQLSYLEPALYSENFSLGGDSIDRRFGQYECKSYITAFKISIIEQLRNKGWFPDEVDYDSIVRTPYTAIENGDDIVFLDKHEFDHQMFDLDGIPHAIGSSFNYMLSEGGMNNRYYDLKEVMKILQGRDDIKNLKYSDIPYYNAEEDMTKQLSFMWTPSREDYIRCFENKTFSGIQGSCIHLDIFGIKQHRRE